MADIFTKRDAQNLLKDRTLWLFGDSNMRGIYKDIIWLLERNSLIALPALKSKLERSYMTDRLVKGGPLNRGRTFHEIRHYKNPTSKTRIEFTFLTYCMSADIQLKLNEAKKEKEFPDVVLINSCLWDITRWGPHSIEKYKANLIDLLKLLKATLPNETRVVWATTPPISTDPHGGFIIRQINFLKHTMRFEVMEANVFVSRAVLEFGFDIVDIHFYFLFLIEKRRPDGIHWTPEAVRHMTNLFLTHFCVCWNSPLPGNFKSPLLDELKRGFPRPFKPKEIRAMNAVEAVKENEGEGVFKEVKEIQKQDDFEEIEVIKVVKPVKATVAGSSGIQPESSCKKESKSQKRKRRRHRNRKKGQKRDANGNVIGSYGRLNFAEDVYDYDYVNKRFKLEGFPGRTF